MSLMIEALKQLFQAPATLKYPFEKRVPPEKFRGRPIWNMSKCIGCGLCERVCPSAAIKMIGRKLESEIKHYVGRCIFCGQCVESCPRNAISMSGEYELAQLQYGCLLYEYKH